MSIACLCTLLLLFADGVAHPGQSLYLEPLDLHDGGEIFYLSSIDQIETSEGRVFVRGLRETTLLEIDERGTVLQKLGRKGEGPGEWGKFGVLALGASGDEVWGITPEGRALGYQGGQFSGSFSLPPLAWNISLSSNEFALSDQFLVVPALGNAGYLATIYDRKGTKVRDLGEPLAFDDEATTFNPQLNTTLWTYHNGAYYALFRFYPMLLQVSADFSKIRQIPLDHPDFADAQKGRTNVDDSPQQYHGAPLFTDFQVGEDRVWVMSSGALYELDLATGRFLEKTRFIGGSSDFGDVQGKVVDLPRFARLPSGKLLLAHPAHLWDHPLWQAVTRP